MQHILKIIENDLKNLSKDEREEFRTAILSSFMKVTSGIDKKITSFEKRILETVGETKEKIDIFVALISKDEYYLYEDKFFPMIKNDESSLNDILSMNEKKYKDIYLSIPSNKISQYHGKILKGFITIKEEVFQIKFRLIFNSKYEDKVKKLYEIFNLNNLKWKTLLNPYLKKMFTLEIVEYDEVLLSILDGTEKIEIEKEDFKDIWHEDILLCWNIKGKEVLGEGIIRPTKDRIHLENILNFSSNRNIYICPIEDCNIYLVEKIGQEQIMIISEDKKNIIWKIWEIQEVEEEKLIKLKFKSFNNKMELHFINKLKLEKDLRIRTVSELERILNSFPIFRKYFTFVTTVVTEKEEDFIGYEVNSFILDEFRLKGYQKVLKIKFKNLREDEFTNDILSFVISEIQIYFPEYKCIGELI
ncbi:hypothetical protein H3N56_11535 [Cetobacterium sp. 2A]|uniref:hypothetical protein n=1 Tax=Cetobacterium sp. 2A TaxID=2754723 RepID=UPI00163C79E1|nr:hypothetical protein [Cetobacterium sp. 2A]MBC2857064.1 hypothetical protein [Cetobacterium sp. 2A]